MNDPQYEEQLSVMSDKGLVLDSRIERKQVNGLYGMYATAPIKMGEVLASVPTTFKMPLSTRFNYPKNTSFDLKFAHTAAIELSKGKDSDYYVYFLKMETLDELKDNSCYFYTDEELNLIKQLNPILLSKIVEYRQAIKHFVEVITGIDSTINVEELTRVILNVNSRSWTNTGTLPIFELFNHCDVRGVTMRELENGSKRAYVARIDYEVGEQIWVSYGKRDMYEFAISFNYFDPSGTHFINLGKRIIQQARSDFEKSVFSHAAKKYTLKSSNVNGVINYTINDHEAALFIEGAPNAKLLDYIRDTSFQTIEELSNGKSTPASFDKKMLSVLDFLMHVNNVDKFTLDDIPEKLQRFYFMLIKEKQMLLANKKWVIMNSADYIFIPDLKLLC